MKLTLRFDDEFGFESSIRSAIEADVGRLGLPSDEAAALFEIRDRKLRNALERWCEHDGLIKIEIDTDAGTAVVIPQRDPS
jgi:hypothetical protein